MLFLSIELPCERSLLLAQLSGSAAFASAGPGCGQAGARSLTDEVALEFREGPEDVEDQPSTAGCGVDGFL